MAPDNRRFAALSRTLEGIQARPDGPATTWSDLMRALHASPGTHLQRVVSLNDDGSVVLGDLAGQPLDEVVGRGLAPVVVSRLLGQIAAALAHIHDLGGAHGALTPRSVRVYESTASVLVEDAVVLDDDHETLLDAQRLDGSACVELLYFMLTGDRYHPGPLGRPSVPRDNGMPVPPSTLNPQVDVNLDAVALTSAVLPYPTVCRAIALQLGALEASAKEENVAEAAAAEAVATHRYVDDDAGIQLPLPPATRHPLRSADSESQGDDPAQVTGVLSLTEAQAQLAALSREASADAHTGMYDEADGENQATNEAAARSHGVDRVETVGLLLPTPAGDRDEQPPSTPDSRAGDDTSTAIMQRVPGRHVGEAKPEPMGRHAAATDAAPAGETATAADGGDPVTEPVTLPQDESRTQAEPATAAESQAEPEDEPIPESQPTPGPEAIDGVPHEEAAAEVTRPDLPDESDLTEDLQPTAADPHVDAEETAEAREQADEVTEIPEADDSAGTFADGANGDGEAPDNGEASEPVDAPASAAEAFQRHHGTPLPAALSRRIDQAAAAEAARQARRAVAEAQTPALPAPSPVPPADEPAESLETSQIPLVELQSMDLDPTEPARPPASRPQTRTSRASRRVSRFLGYYFGDPIDPAAMSATDRQPVDAQRLIFRACAAGLAAAFILAVAVMLWPLPKPSSTAADAPAPSASASASASPTATPTPTPTAKPQIAQITVVDPEGDGKEHPELLGNLTDSRDDTSWYSRTYDSDSYGMKRGIGLVINLKQTATLSRITLTGTDVGGLIEVKTSAPEDAADAPTITQGPLTNGETTFTLDKPADVDRVILWVPKLPTDTQTNRFRLALSSVSVD